MYKDFLKKTFISGFILIVMYLGIIISFNEYFIRNIVISKDSSIKKFFNNSQIVVLGDSHPAWSIENDNNEILNLAVPDNNYCINYYILKNYLKKAKSPKVVLIQYDFIQLSSSRDLKSNYLDYFNIVPLKAINESGYKWDLNSLLYVAGLKQFKKEYAPNIFKMIFKYYSAKDKNNVINTEQQETNWKKTDQQSKNLLIKKRITEQFGNQTFSEFNYKYLLKIIDLCQQKGITPIIVTYPAAPEYISQIPDNVKIKFYEKLKQSPLNKLKYLNFIDLYYNKTEYLSDIDHLNTDGKKNFTEIILKKL